MATKGKTRGVMYNHVKGGFQYCEFPKDRPEVVVIINPSKIFADEQQAIQYAMDLAKDSRIAYSTEEIERWRMDGEDPPPEKELYSAEEKELFDKVLVSALAGAGDGNNYTDSDTWTSDAYRVSICTGIAAEAVKQRREFFKEMEA